MRLLKIFSILVVALGVAAVAVVVGPPLYRHMGSTALAQSGPRVLLPERPFDSAEQGTRGRALTVLAGRGAGIGVRIADTDGGVVIEEVDPDSPADKAGLKQSDVIVSFDGERVRSARQFARLVQETPSGRSVKATVRRDGQQREVDVTPDDRRGDMMLSSDMSAYMRDLGRDLGRLGDRLPFNFNFDFNAPGVFSGRRLGITINELTPQLADYFGAKEGVLVASVSEGSAAAHAGLKAGDVITSIDGASVRSRDDLLRRLRESINDEVTVGIVRDKKDTTVKATIEGQTRRPRGRPA
jgi:serine protease Do